MRVLVFDTETTDLKGYAVEIAYIVLTPEKGKLRPRKGRVAGINPLSSVNPEVVEKFFIDEEKLRRLPPFSAFWEKARKDFLQADLIVAHNLKFDMSVLERELLRMGNLKDLMALRKKRGFCTCRDLARKMKLRKWPKLEEALGLLFIPRKRVEHFYEAVREKLGYNPLNIRTKEISFHNALFDTAALCYIVAEAWEMIRAEIDSPPFPKLF